MSEEVPLIGLNDRQKTEVKNIVLSSFLAGGAVFAILAVVLTQVVPYLTAESAKNTLVKAEGRLAALGAAPLVDGWPYLVRCELTGAPGSYKIFHLTNVSNSGDVYYKNLEERFDDEMHFDPQGARLLEGLTKPERFVDCRINTTTIQSVIDSGNAYGLVSLNNGASQ